MQLHSVVVRLSFTYSESMPQVLGDIHVYAFFNLMIIWMKLGIKIQSEKPTA